MENFIVVFDGTSAFVTDGNDELSFSIEIVDSFNNIDDAQECADTYNSNI